MHTLFGQPFAVPHRDGRHLRAPHHNSADGILHRAGFDAAAFQDKTCVSVYEGLLCGV